MISVERVETTGWEPTFRGLRNPRDSWERADSRFVDGKFVIGPNDEGLIKWMIKAGTNDHPKFRRMLCIYADVTAPLYWWKQFDTYKIGTVSNSCSTMHTLAKKPFELDMFSTDRLLPGSIEEFQKIIDVLNEYRRLYLEHDAYAKDYREKRNYRLAEDHWGKAQSWWAQMVQTLPTSFNQMRTIMLNYQVMAEIYRARKGHKLEEWQDFRDIMARECPNSWIFTGEGV